MFLNYFLLRFTDWNFLWYLLFILLIFSLRTVIRHVCFKLFNIDLPVFLYNYGWWFFSEERGVRLLSHYSFHDLFSNFVKLSGRFFINKHHFYFFFLWRLWNESLFITAFYPYLHSLVCKNYKNYVCINSHR